MTRTVTTLALCLAVAGCGGLGGNVKQTNDLKQLLMGYHMYHDTHQKGPPGATEFLGYAQKMSEKNLQVLIQDAQRGEWVIFYGVKLSTLPDGTPNTVLMYHKDAPTKGASSAWQTPASRR